MEYLLDRLKGEIAGHISNSLGIKADFSQYIEKPSKPELGDLSFPCFHLAKELKKKPEEIAKTIASKPVEGMLADVRAVGPYANFFVDWRRAGQLLLEQILRLEKNYGSQNKKGKIIVIDFSSPNIAKPMSVGHLRSTVIGQALHNILSFLGYDCIADNHLGDWGTQFGKLIAAYKKWGNREEIEREPIKKLLELYVRFHREADKKLEDLARKYFKALESGDRECVKLWKWFCELSKKEFEKIYSILGVKFDYQLGESYYVKKALKIVESALKKGIAKKSAGAVIVPLDKFGMPPCVIQKADESTLYSTRDLATIAFRKRKFKPWRILYVVGSEQKLYFRQIFKVAELLGLAKEEELVHVDFGLVTLPGGKMSTRKGRVVYLSELIEKSIDMAKSIIEEKNPNLKGKDEIAQDVAIGAIKYNDLSRDRVKNISFEWQKFLSFEGNTGPYLQYSHARACSILRKFGREIPKFEVWLLQEDKEIELLRLLADFPKIVEDAGRDYKPHYIAGYAYSLATAFNEFYQAVRVLQAPDELRDARLALVKAVKIVLGNALRLLGIKPLQRM